MSILAPLTLLLLSTAFANPIPQFSGSNTPDSAAGAEGSEGNAYNLSTGGLIAIIVVVVVAVIVGVATLWLFIVAKRNQTTMRETMRRASRRMTGRTLPRGAGAEGASGRKSRVGGMSRRGDGVSPDRAALVGDGEIKAKKARPGTLMGATQLDRLKGQKETGLRVETKEVGRKVQAILPSRK